MKAIRILALFRLAGEETLVFSGRLKSYLKFFIDDFFRSPRSQSSPDAVGALRSRRRSAGAARVNHGSVAVTRFNRIGYELHRTITHEHVGATLVAA